MNAIVKAIIPEESFYTDNAIPMMPIGGKLTACELKAIKSWIDHQSPDN